MVHHPEFLRQGHVMVQEKRRTIAGSTYVFLLLTL